MPHCICAYASTSTNFAKTYFTTQKVVCLTRVKPQKPVQSITHCLFILLDIFLAEMLIWKAKARKCWKNYEPSCVWLIRKHHKRHSTNENSKKRSFGNFCWIWLDWWLCIVLVCNIHLARKFTCKAKMQKFGRKSKPAISGILLSTETRLFPAETAKLWEKLRNLKNVSSYARCIVENQPQKNQDWKSRKKSKLTIFIN